MTLPVNVEPTVATPAVAMSEAALVYIADALTDILMHDGRITFPVSLAMAPTIADQIDAFVEACGVTIHTARKGG